MTSRISTVLLVILILIAGTAQADMYRYGPVSEIHGVLVTYTADSEITFDEKSHIFFALQLAKPINVLCPVTAKYCVPETGVMLMQLVLNPDQIKQFKELKGRDVRISGELFHSDNGHHFTSVLLAVQSLVP